jgi:hypothetical protein
MRGARRRCRFVQPGLGEAQMGRRNRPRLIPSPFAARVPGAKSGTSPIVSPSEARKPVSSTSARSRTVAQPGSTLARRRSPGTASHSESIISMSTSSARSSGAPPTRSAPGVPIRRARTLRPDRRRDDDPRHRPPRPSAGHMCDPIGNCGVIGAQDAAISSPSTNRSAAGRRPRPRAVATAPTTSTGHLSSTRSPVGRHRTTTAGSQRAPPATRAAPDGGRRAPECSVPSQCRATPRARRWPCAPSRPARPRRPPRRHHSRRIPSRR